MAILEKKLKEYFKSKGVSETDSVTYVDEIKELLLKDDMLIREAIDYKADKSIMEYSGIKIDFKTNDLYLDDVVQPKSMIIVSQHPKKKKKNSATKETPRTLTPTLRRILMLFLLNPKVIFSREQILNYAWDEQKNLVVDRAVDSHIFRLKKFLKQHGDKIKTVSGLGYRLE